MCCDSSCDDGGNDVDGDDAGNPKVSTRFHEW